MSWVQTAKQAATLAALEEIADARVIGIGSGTTLELLVSELAATMKSKAFGLKLIPTSHQIEAAMKKAGLAAANPYEVTEIDLALDGADQVASQTLNLIKGGGAAMTREKIIDTAAKKLVIIVDERKLAEKLGSGQPVPLEVLPFAYKLAMSRLIRLDGKPSLRYDADSNLVTTDNGNFIVDVDFGPIEDAHLLESRLKSIPGIVESGLFLDMTDRVYVGLRSGKVKVLNSK